MSKDARRRRRAAEARLVSRRGQSGELLPRGGFYRWKATALTPAELGGSAWRNQHGLQVLSTHAMAFLPGTQEQQVGPQWHLSVSVAAEWGKLRRPSDDDMALVVDRFGMPAWDEDNHHPGRARHLWCPVDEAYRNECECKLTETLVVEVDGYRWTNPTDATCRGCTYELLTGDPCPIHQVALGD